MSLKTKLVHHDIYRSGQRYSPLQQYNKILEVIGKKSFASLNDHKYYNNMFHGWAAARGDLNNEENKRE